MSYIPLRNHADYEILNEYPFTIRRNRDNYIITEFIKDSGYPAVVLNGRHYLKHRLIAEQFIENDDPERKTQIDHINRNKTDYHLDNLRWITNRDNSRNKSANKGITYNYIDELPGDCIDVTSYETTNGMREFEDKEYYYSPSTDLFYFYNGKQYRVLHVMHGYNDALYVNLLDKNKRLVAVCYTKFKVQYDII